MTGEGDVTTSAVETGRLSKPGLRRVTVAGLATYVPPRVLTNADLEKMVETSDEWIQQRTGIRERHIVDAGVATSDLAKEVMHAASPKRSRTSADRSTRGPHATRRCFMPARWHPMSGWGSN